MDCPTCNVLRSEIANLENILTAAEVERDALRDKLAAAEVERDAANYIRRELEAHVREDLPEGFMS